jgi:hypothetical protein
VRRNTIALLVAGLVEEQLQHDMAGRDAPLLGAPAELPERAVGALLRHLLAVVEAGDVAPAEEGVGEAVLGVVELDVLCRIVMHTRQV